MSNLGWTEFDILNANQLYVNGQPFTAYISNLIAEDNLEQVEIDEIKSFLARLDLQITAPNTLTITNENRNSVLKSRLDTAATDITTLTTRVTTAETDIDNLETRATTDETNITAIKRPLPLPLLLLQARLAVFVRGRLQLQAVARRRLRARHRPQRQR